MFVVQKQCNIRQSKTDCRNIIFVSIESYISHLIPEGRFCKVCGDSDSNIPCDTRTIFLGDSVECPAGQDFCMTDIIHDSSNNEMIFKR